MRNEISFCELTDMIDENIKNAENFLVVCDKNLKDNLSDYFRNVYDLIDEDEDKNCDEYYISLHWRGNEHEYYVESAKGISGEYKLCDTYECDYYICVDMDTQVADDKFIGDMMFCKLIGCDECEYLDCEDDEDMDVEVEFIMDKAEELLNRDFCPDYAMEFVANIFRIGKTIGFQECKLKMENFIGNFDDELLM